MEPSRNNIYDVLIVGGGLAGLSLLLQCRRAGLYACLLEKETYPFHKVCGEYISNESLPFLHNLAPGLEDISLPQMEKLVISSGNGTRLEIKLPLGGFGISRYFLDHMLCNIAKNEGAAIFENVKAEDISFYDDRFTVKASDGQVRYAHVVAGCYGKRSNIDVKMQRPFITDKPNSLNNYLGVKYHVRADMPKDQIALHHFKNGYCGVSAIEEDKFCICYLTTAKNLKEAGSITALEEKVLAKNPLLKNILQSSEYIYDKPLTISQISFAAKAKVEDHILFIGDAAGMIPPLSGNGMSMALHASKLAFGAIQQYIKGEINRQEMEKMYSNSWDKNFKRRLHTGRILQKLYVQNISSDFLVKLVRPFPSFVSKIVERTHGSVF